jgi:hypothetical protein
MKREESHLNGRRDREPDAGREATRLRRIVRAAGLLRPTAPNEPPFLSFVPRLQDYPGRRPA